MPKKELPRSDGWRGLKTRWSILDDFIERLAEKGDEICYESEIRNKYYEELRSLVCNGNTEVLETIKLGPYYHFILISYYALFHKKDFDLAYKIFQKIHKIYEEDKTLFNDDEERSLNYLRLIFEKLKTIRNNCNMYKPGSGYLITMLKDIAEDLKQTKNTVKDAWSTLFKDLLIIHLNPDPANKKEIRTKISQIKDTVETLSDERNLLTREIIDGYNIFFGGLSIPPYYFIYYMAQKTENTLTKKFNKYKKYKQHYKNWKKLETRLKKISNMFTRAKDILSKNKVVEIIITLIASSSLFSLFIIHSVFSINLLSLLNEILILVFTGLLLVILFIIIVINKFLRRIERQINSFIEIEMLKDIYLSICRTR
jgi:DNA repair exonuclease SbcCD ATPase subunit